MERGASAKIAAASFNRSTDMPVWAATCSNETSSHGGFQCGKGLRMFLDAVLVDQVQFQRRLHESVDHESFRSWLDQDGWDASLADVGDRRNR